jgi:hypothetical protein
LIGADIKAEEGEQKEKNKKNIFYVDYEDLRSLFWAKCTELDCIGA